MFSSCAAVPASSSSVRQDCWSFPSMELPMADRAILQLFYVNVIRINQFRSFDLLLLTFRPFPSNIKNLVPRPQILVRLSVALQAPFHLKRRALLRQRHLIDPPMTRSAPHALLNMNPVIEIGVIGQIVHPRP